MKFNKNKKRKFNLEYFMFIIMNHRSSAAKTSVNKIGLNTLNVINYYRFASEY